MPASPALQQARQCLQHYFGFSAFRPLQAEVIEQVVLGGNALVLMPTGGGKSLCYQIPSLVRSGTGIVISPLIALMADQVQALQRQGVRAAYLNSSQEREAALAVEEATRRGEIDLLYVAPERALLPSFQHLLQGLQIALIAIDEAHCVSQWGHDFRPEYGRLGTLVERYADIPRVALTATADEATRQDIRRVLHLPEAQTPCFLGSFDRPNICYHVFPGLSRPREALLAFIQDRHAGEAGIVYCMTRKQCETTAHWLAQRGLDARAYHAGMDRAERERLLMAFLHGEASIMVATVAFGMGIDKPDVRFVAHLNLPRSVEAYYQETGRAGRDGLPANAWLTFNLQDVVRQQQWIFASEAPAERKDVELRNLLALLEYCEESSCRRAWLLAFFGCTSPAADVRRVRCDHCDNCLQPVAAWEATEWARMALSAVWRTGQRFGVQYLCAVLRGVSSVRIKAAGHDQLQIFGMARSLGEDQLRSLFRQLVGRGLLQPSPDGVGSLQLTARCRPLLQGRESLSLRMDRAPARTQGLARVRRPGAPDMDSALLPAWETLRACRTRLARQDGIPPYMVFNDATLLDMLQQRPSNLAALSRISGVGEKKLDRYGADFLAALNNVD